MSTSKHDLDSTPFWANLLAHVSRHLPAGKYRIIDWVRRARPKRFVARLPMHLGGYIFEFSSLDNVASQVFFAGCYEAQESAFARAMLRPGMTFVDVGANWGFFTLMAAHLVGKQGRIVSLEPDSRSFLRLNANIERNGLEQVKTFELAAADCDQNFTLSLQNESILHLGTSRFVQANEGVTNARVIRSQPLDFLLDEEGLDTVDLVKIDVEGAEDLVLGGMEAGLKRQRYRSMILELHPPQLADRKRTVTEIVDLLQSRGYKGFGLDHSPVAHRRACYHPESPVKEFLVPLEDALADPWPHTAWLARGQADLF